MRLMIGLLALLSFKLYAAPMIHRIYDGDTVEIVDADQHYHLRINDIDAPERNQAYGKISRRALVKLCAKATIDVTLTGIDRYQRRLGKLSCNQQDVSHYMVKNGYAWFYVYYASDATLVAEEQVARSKHLGLWQADLPQPPWIWRKMHQQDYIK